MTLEDSKNPWGIIEGIGTEYPESRGFARLYAGNPYAQSRLLETLVGLHKFASEKHDLTGEMSEKDKLLAVAGIAQVIAYFDQQFRHWRLPSFDLNSDFGLPTYLAEERLVNLVDGVIADVGAEVESN